MTALSKHVLRLCIPFFVALLMLTTGEGTTDSSLPTKEISSLRPTQDPTS